MTVDDDIENGGDISYTDTSDETIIRFIFKTEKQWNRLNTT